MHTPPEIIFHGVPRSEWVERYVARRIERLDQLSDDVISCHVTIESDQHRHHTGNVYRVVVELRLPRHKQLAATKERIIDDMETQLRALVRAAFEAIERQLKEAVQRRRYEIKTHGEEAPHGLVAKIYRQDGYGFIRTPDDREFYFHRNSVLHDDFDRLEFGTEVRFEPEMGEDGPQASSVQVVAKPGARASEPLSP